MDWTVSIKPEPKKNDANAFVTPRRNNNSVSRTKMTPNDMEMCINVIKRSYMNLPEVFEDFLRAYAGLLVKVY